MWRSAANVEVDVIASDVIPECCRLLPASLAYFFLIRDASSAHQEIFIYRMISQSNLLSQHLLHDFMFLM